MPFVVAFAVAVVTAFSYLELVTKYPRAAGAALYTHRAFGIHFITFIVAFAVMCSRSWCCARKRANPTISAHRPSCR
jgi:basic amino acid/polyamine antiporter, APA family